MSPRVQLLAFTVMAGVMIAQTSRAAEPHACHDHSDESGIELGFSAGYARLSEDEEHHAETELDGHADHDEAHESDDNGLALHVHVGHRLGEHGLLAHVSLGIAGEVIFAEHDHYGVMGYAALYPWRGLVLSIGPGVEWAKHDDGWESAYTTHLEAAYVFDVGDYHIGPAVDYSRTDSAEHFTVGIHLGVHL